jgi:membrane dipeptidase
MLIVDGHEDLAWNMLTFGRDYTRAAAETRQIEAGGETPSRNGNTLLGWPDYQRARVAVVFATLFAAPARHRLGEWETQYYEDLQQAHKAYSQQLDAYHRLTDEHADKFRLIESQANLDAVLSGWRSTGEDEQPPVGLVVLMEAAEGIRDPGELAMWWERGLRLIGPAWAGTRFCGGSKEPGPLTKEGYALLEGMAEFGFGLDLSHMDEKAALQALDFYPGHILASHSNALALLDGSTSNRHMTDRQIQGLLERDAVIGIVFYNAFLKGGWREGDRREEVRLDRVVAQIDYICQMAGDARHVGIGTDFDGGLGVEATPIEIDTIADVRLVGPMLAERGYSQEDIAAIFGGNWLEFLGKVLPESE